MFPRKIQLHYFGRLFRVIDVLAHTHITVMSLVTFDRVSESPFGRDVVKLGQVRDHRGQDLRSEVIGKISVMFVKRCGKSIWF